MAPLICHQRRPNDTMVKTTTPSVDDTTINTTAYIKNPIRRCVVAGRPQFLDLNKVPDDAFEVQENLRKSVSTHYMEKHTTVSQGQDGHIQMVASCNRDDDLLATFKFPIQDLIELRERSAKVFGHKHVLYFVGAKVDYLCKESRDSEVVCIELRFSTGQRDYDQPTDYLNYEVSLRDFHFFSLLEPAATRGLAVSPAPEDVVW